MSEKLEQMLRVALMNQIEIMAALGDLLHNRPLDYDDLDRRAQTRVSLGNAVEQTIETLKALKEQGPLGSNNLAGQA